MSKKMDKEEKDKEKFLARAGKGRSTSIYITKFLLTQIVLKQHVKISSIQ